MNDIRCTIVTPQVREQTYRFSGLAQPPGEGSAGCGCAQVVTWQNGSTNRRAVEVYALSAGAVGPRETTGDTPPVSTHAAPPATSALRAVRRPRCSSFVPPPAIVAEMHLRRRRRPPVFRRAQRLHTIKRGNVRAHL
jgi:hypothetical protein